MVPALSPVATISSRPNHSRSCHCSTWASTARVGVVIRRGASFIGGSGPVVGQVVDDVAGSLIVDTDGADEQLPIPGVQLGHLNALQHEQGVAAAVCSVPLADGVAVHGYLKEPLAGAVRHARLKTDRRGRGMVERRAVFPKDG